MRRVFIVEEKNERLFSGEIGFTVLLLCLFIGYPIVIIYDCIVGPTQREIYESWGTYENRNVDIQVYQLGGLYNTSKGKDYRVDFDVPNSNNKVIKSMYYDNEDKFKKI